MNTMNFRSMTAPRRCDTSWPQTVQMSYRASSRRVCRSKQNPYRRSRPRGSWRQIASRVFDALCWIVGVAALLYVGAVAYRSTITGLQSLWQ